MLVFSEKGTFQRMPAFQPGLDAAELTSGPACISSSSSFLARVCFPISTFCLDET